MSSQRTTLSRGHRTLNAIILCICLIANGIFIPSQGTVKAAVPSGYSEYFIAGGEDQLFQIFRDIDNDPCLGNAIGGAACPTTDANQNQMHSVVTVAVAADGVTLFYDHWENGYAGTGAGDEIYYADTGDVLTFESSDVDVPRSAGATCSSTNPDGTSTACYDGKDYLYVAGGAVTVGRATWPEVVGTRFSEAFELYPVKPYMTHYTIPFGVDLAATPLDYKDFTKTYIMVQSSRDGNQVQIDDLTTPGVVDKTVILNRGEVADLYQNHTGTTVSAIYPVQVQLFAGQAHSAISSESRAFTAVPSGLWDTAYYNPVPSFVDLRDGDPYPTEVYVYNPTSSALSINYEDGLGSGTITVPAGSTRTVSSLTGHDQPNDSALYLESTDGTTKFWAVGSAATLNSTSTQNSYYDYGYSLVPTKFLKSDYYISWAPGGSPPTANGSPLFITPVADNTTVYVDYSPTNGTVDASYVLDRLQIQKIFDPDNDNSGVHVWATRPLALVWGQDPSTANSGDPYLDVGYINLPLLEDWIDLVLTLDKSANPEAVQGGAGRVSTFTLVVDSHEYTIDDVDVVDTLPPSWAYVDNSTVITRPDGSMLSGNPADPAISGQVLTWNLDQDMDPDETLTVVFQAVTTATAPNGYSINNATATGTRGSAPNLQTFQAKDDATVYVAQLTMSKSAAPAGPLQPGDTLNYTLSVQNTGATRQTNIVVSDPLPEGTSYVTGSGQVQGYKIGSSNYNYLDNFNASPYAFSNSNGSLSWSATPWVEGGENDGANAGSVRMISDGAFGQVFQVGARQVDRTATRTANLSNCTTATLNLRYRRAGLESDDVYTIRVRTNSSTSWNTLRTLTNGTDSSYVPFNQDITAYISSGTQIGFSSNFNGNYGSDYAYVDDVEIVCTVIGVSPVTLASGSPPNLTTPGDGYLLDPGQSMSVTFQVRVNDPLPSGLNEIYNIAYVTSSTQLEPLTGETHTPLAAPASAGDRVWLDEDGDAVQDPGETGLANVMVRLYRDGGAPGPSAGDTLVSTTVTDLNGNYLFTGLAPGSYFVDVVSGVPSGLTISAPLTDPSAVFALVNGQIYRDADFGYHNPASATAIIGDRVWNDADGDGLQDPGEVGIGGVTLELRASGADGLFGTADDVTAASATTAADGSYAFSGVVPGEYVVRVTDSGGVLSGFNLTSGPHSNSNPTAPISVSGGEIYSNADFGYQAGGRYTINDRAWLDANQNGVQDAGENGIPGISVDLVRDTNGNGIWDSGEPVIATGLTDTSGDFAFPGLSNGSYLVVMSDNLGRVEDHQRSTQPARAGLLSVTLAGSSVSGVHFGYFRKGSIGDTVFSDANSNQAQDPGEPGISGVSIQLWKDDNGDGVFDNTVDTLVGTRVTDVSGTYLFTGLGRGTYFASVDGGQSALSGYTATTTDQQAGVNAPGVQINAILPADGDSYLKADFGFHLTPGYRLGDKVWLDSNRDGAESPGEAGISGVTLDLYKDTNGNGMLDPGEVRLGTTTTDSAGGYAFDGLPNGEYLVAVSDRSGVLAGYEMTAGLEPWPVTINNANKLEIDFGFVRTPSTGAIGDLIWLDTDRNGIPDVTEAPLPNVLVQLYLTGPDGQPGGGDDNLVTSTTTGMDGRYIFNELPPGMYFVQVENSNFAAGGALEGLAPVSGSNQHGPIALSAGETYLSADIGYQAAAGYSLGDWVWLDANQDGRQDPGEPGMSGVVIELLDGDGQPLGVTTLTAPDGSYLFTGLATGNYRTRLAPSNFEPGGVLEGYTITDGPLSPGSNTSRLGTLSAANPSATFLDFGLYKDGLGSIGDRVWLDASLEGVQDAGEPGISGVTLDLVLDMNGNGVRDAGEPVIASTETDGGGSYRFNGLALDTAYLVTVSDRNNRLAGFSQTNNAQVPDPAAVMLTSAAPDRLDVDFGYDDPDLGDFIWHDGDHDGIQDADENGIGGVTVGLYSDRDADGVIDAGLDSLLRTTTTDSLGFYQFGGLPFESFIVKIENSNFQPGGALAGFSLTLANQGSDVALDSNANSNHEMAITPLGPKDFTLDAGYYAPTGYTIGDLIWRDVENLGVKDPSELGIPGVTVVLYRDTDGNGWIGARDTILGRTITDANGLYRFTNLPNGSYIVRVTDAFGALRDHRWINGFHPNTNNYSQFPTLAVTVSGSDINFADSGYYISPEHPTAVQMASFDAIFSVDRALVQWETVTELEIVGFNLYRAADLDSTPEKLNTELILVKNPGGISGERYLFEDIGVTFGQKFFYWLEVMDIEGNLHLIGPESVTYTYSVYIPLVVQTP